MLARFLIGQITGFAIGVWIGGITTGHWPWRTPFFGVAAFFAAAAGHNTLQTHATQMAPERCGTAVAAFASCFLLGQSAGVGIAGRVVADSGTGWVLAAGAAGGAGLGLQPAARAGIAGWIQRGNLSAGDRAGSRRVSPNR